MPTTGSPGTPRAVQRPVDYFRPESKASSLSRAVLYSVPVCRPVKNCTESPLKSAKQAAGKNRSLAPLSVLRPVSVFDRSFAA